MTEECICTIAISGLNAERFLTRKGLLPTTKKVGDGEFIVGSSTNGIIQTQAGDIKVAFGLVTATNNREVVLNHAGFLRRTGTRTRCRVSVSGFDGLGRQEISNGVVLCVTTNASRSVFEANKR